MIFHMLFFVPESHPYHSPSSPLVNMHWSVVILLILPGQTQGFPLAEAFPNQTHWINLISILTM